MAELNCLHCNMYGECKLRSNYDFSFPCQGDECCKEYEAVDDE
jgi:hypothetical protein